MNLMSNLTRRLREIAAVADVRPKPAPKPDPMKAVDRALAKEPPRPIPPLPAGIKAANEAINAMAPVTPSAFDKFAFFTHLRGTELRHHKPSQVEGTEAILKKLEGLRTSWVAYALATAWHETAATMQPIKEYGSDAYFNARYGPEGKKPQIAHALGNTIKGDGSRFAGRGYVQLTGRRNYERAGATVGCDLIGDPDLAMRADIAAEIMRAGMIEGWFTGRKFASALPEAVASREQFCDARRIINGTDKADKIAGYARTFQTALIAGDWT
jgi:predicted chitinase